MGSFSVDDDRRYIDAGGQGQELLLPDGKSA